MAPAPFAPSKAWKERAEDGEQELAENFAREIMAFQQEDAKQGKLLRGFHAKIHAGLIGEFEVLSGLPEYARQGVFSTPQTFQALVRFSNGESTEQKDGGHEPRGIAIKLLGVGGPKLLPDQRDAVTQDFLATSHSVTSAVRNIRQFAAFVRAHRGGSLKKLAVELSRAIGVPETGRILVALVFRVILSRVRSMATEQFSGTAPIKFGPYAVKFTITPSADTSAPERLAKTDDFLHQELADRLRKGDLRLDFFVQFYVDDEKTPIEDTSVAWKPRHTPLLKVAQLRIRSCNIDDPSGRKLISDVNRLAFSPWHAIADHQPLGSIMRARRFAYDASSNLRRHAPEPTGLPLQSVNDPEIA